MSYDDGRVACTDDALVIRLYYFPFGDKRIPWDRPKKSVALIVSISGRHMRPVINPDDPDAVAAELASHGVTVGLAGQPDAEAGAGELQQDLAGACEAATFAALAG